MPYEKRSSAPPDLQLLIDAFNALPRYAADNEQAVAELVNIAQSEIASAFTDKDIEKAERLDAIYNDQISSLIPNEIRQAFQESDRVYKAPDAIGRLFVEKMILTDTVRAFWRFRKPGIPLDRDLNWNVRREEFVPEGSQMYPLQFRKDGTVTSASRVLRILDRISPERIRICEICETIFWAKKGNAWSCSPSCAIKLGNRKRLAKAKVS